MAVSRSPARPLRRSTEAGPSGIPENAESLLKLLGHSETSSFYSGVGQIHVVFSLVSGCFSFVLGLILLCIALYNQLVGRKNEVENAFSSVDVLLKKRCDLVPNLVATAKQYLQFEQKTLVDVTRLRSQVVS